MNEFTHQQLNSLVESALGTLKKERDRDVLRRRGGISTEAQTLEKIGKDMNITRERVRQIEKSALLRLQDKYDSKQSFTLALNSLISKNGGLISLEGLSQATMLDSILIPQVIFLIKINPDIVFVDRNDYYTAIIADAASFKAESIRSIHDDLVETIRDHNKPAKFTNIYKLIDGPHSQETLLEIAKASRHLSQLDGNWGLTSWPEVNPKSIRDKIYLVLKKIGRPIHFSEIADKISVVAANPKKVTTQAVHNELIKDPRFVLIGRGIYALSEWGYRSGTVADIINDILIEEKGPLAKDEIVRRVLARRQVKTTTIVLNLQEKPQFKRIEKGVYGLA
ncbi:hypothetical protein EXS53_00490 [Patescibacteria group bacterium]|nr:hypothetical protein [Patescibacteria group bacterium]